MMIRYFSDSMPPYMQGRIFGLEKGFEKFAELGHLHGRSVIWGSRLPSLVPNNTKGADEKTEPENKTLPLLSKNERLKNNTTLLHSLTDPETFDTANTEEAVADFDDRFKRAGAKAKVIERIVGETDDTLSSKSPDGSPAPAGRKSKTGPVRVTGQSKTAGGNAKKGDDSMEDFAGSKLLR